MIQYVYSIYDSKAEAYLRPFFVPTKGLALRSVGDEVNNPSSNLHKYAQDYTLFEIGEYDDSTGIITMHKTHINLGMLHELIIKSDQRPTSSLEEFRNALQPDQETKKEERASNVQ